MLAVRQFKNRELIRLDQELIPGRNVAEENFTPTNFFEPVNFVTVEE